jgi:hypothetical protein
MTSEHERRSFVRAFVPLVVNGSLPFGATMDSSGYLKATVDFALEGEDAEFRAATVKAGMTMTFAQASLRQSMRPSRRPLVAKHGRSIPPRDCRTRVNGDPAGHERRNCLQSVGIRQKVAAGSIRRQPASPSGERVSGP